jgi:hypothetical protein
VLANLGSLSFPDAVAQVLVPLPSFQGGCREFEIGLNCTPFLDSLSRTLPGGEDEIPTGQKAPAHALLVGYVIKGLERDLRAMAKTTVVSPNFKKGGKSK